MPIEERDHLLDRIERLRQELHLREAVRHALDDHVLVTGAGCGCHEVRSPGSWFLKGNGGRLIRYRQAGYHRWRRGPGGRCRWSRRCRCGSGWGSCVARVGRDGPSIRGRPGIWTGVLPLKDLKAGPIEVSVQFVNRAGLSSFATVAVELTDADPALATPGAIEGTVVEGPLPHVS